MPSIKNQTQLKQLEKALADSKAVILTDYAGMSVLAQSKLKQALKETGGRFGVVKNTLLALALKNRVNELSENALQALEGPTAIILTSDSDPVSPAKILVKFIKDHDLPTIKLGILDDKILSATEVENLSRLPGREELLGQLVAQLNAPIYGFAQVLRANLQNLVFAVDAIRRSKTA